MTHTHDSKRNNAIIIYFLMFFLVMPSFAIQYPTPLAPLNPTANVSDYASFSGNYSDHGIDADSDGKYDFLAFDIGINVQYPGEYSIIGTLSTLYDENIAWSNDHGNLSQGYNTMHLMYDGRSIRKCGLNGSYRLAGIYLLNGSSDTDMDIIDFVPNIYISQFYNFTDFANNFAELSTQNLPEINVSGAGLGNLLLTISIKKRLPVISGSYSYDITGIHIPPIIFENVKSKLETGYSYSLPGVFIPGKPNNFTVSTIQAKNLNIGLMKLQGGYGNYTAIWDAESTRIWIATQTQADKYGVATKDSDLLSPGIYHVKIFGDAAENATQVNLTMTLVKKIIVSGPFNLSLNTTGFPDGDYSIDLKAINGSFQLDEIALEDLPL